MIDKKIITKEIMNQYEIIRRTGACNMYDYGCVVGVADQFEMYELGSLERKEYVYILQNFSRLMKKYNIKQ